MAIEIVVMSAIEDEQPRSPHEAMSLEDYYFGDFIEDDDQGPPGPDPSVALPDIVVDAKS